MSPGEAVFLCVFMYALLGFATVMILLAMDEVPYDGPQRLLVGIAAMWPLMVMALVCLGVRDAWKWIWKSGKQGEGR